MKFNRGKNIFPTLLMLCLLFISTIISSVAHADLFSTLKDAAEIIKQTGILNKTGNTDKTESTQPSAPTPAQTNTTENGSASSAINTASNSDLPLGLTEYPQAALHDRIDNPFDELIIPISPPKRITSDKWVPRYSVPVQGKVTMLQFTHEADDSPLLIQKHYESWLAVNGFERMLICKAPCKQADSIYWLPYIDQARRMEFHMFPKDATYIAVYKENAMALVGVGKSGNQAHASFVKLVEGKVLDNTNWKLLNSSTPPLPEVAPSAPAVNQASIKPIFNSSYNYVNKPLPTPKKLVEEPVITFPNTKVAPLGIKEIPFDMAMAESINKSQSIETGGLVAMLITKKSDCEICIKQNSLFEKSAQKHAGKLTFIRATAPADPRVVFGDIVKYVAFPSMMLYQDGKYAANPYWVENDDDLDEVVSKHNSNNSENLAKIISWNNAIKLREKRGIPVPQVPAKPVSLNLPANGSAPTTMLHASLNANSPDELLNWAEGSEGIYVVHASSNDYACSFCRKSDPVYKELAKKYSGRASFMRATAADLWKDSFSSEFALAYQLRALPATFVFKDGQLIRRLDGYYSLEKMDAALMR